MIEQLDRGTIWCAGTGRHRRPLAHPPGAVDADERVHPASDEENIPTSGAHAGPPPRADPRPRRRGRGAPAADARAPPPGAADRQVPVRHRPRIDPGGHNFLSLLGIAVDLFMHTVRRPFLITGLASLGVFLLGVAMLVLGPSLAGLVLARRRPRRAALAGRRVRPPHLRAGPGHSVLQAARPGSGGERRTGRSAAVEQQRTRDPGLTVGRARDLLVELMTSSSESVLARADRATTGLAYAEIERIRRRRATSSCGATCGRAGRSC